MVNLSPGFSIVMNEYCMSTKNVKERTSNVLAMSTAVKVEVTAKYQEKASKILGQYFYLN